MFVLTEMASSDSGTASDNSNIGSAVGSFVGGATGSRDGIAMPEEPAVMQAGVLSTTMLEQDAVPDPFVWISIAGTAK